MYEGDKVLFLTLEAMPIPHSKKGSRMYTVGIVTDIKRSSSGVIVFVVDNCGDKHVVFERFVHVILPLSHVPHEASIELFNPL